MKELSDKRTIPDTSPGEKSAAMPGTASAGAPWISLLVWVSRILVGATFIVSGVSKAIDVWGGFYKLCEYEAVWGLEISHSITVAASFALCIWETLLGVMLLLGCFRRAVCWGLLATMAVMLPLSLYIYIFTPVADCGCFGDFIVLSNPATFYKNVLLTAAIIFLIPYNRKVVALISPYLQWIGAIAVVLYTLAVALIGYHIQPMCDFRAFPVGSSLADGVEAARETPDIEDFSFIYEKDGVRQEFSSDSLPDDSWTFVDRRLLQEPSVGENDASPDLLTLYNEMGEEPQEPAISDSGEQMLVLIPDPRRIDISSTSTINAINRHLQLTGGSVAGIIGGGRRDLLAWRDLSMAEYPLFLADPLQIKALARGDVALVLLHDGKVVWKRTAASIDSETLEQNLETRPLDQWAPPAVRTFKGLTTILVVILIFIIFADGLRRGVRLAFRRRNKHRQFTAQNQKSANK